MFLKRNDKFENRGSNTIGIKGLTIQSWILTPSWANLEQTHLSNLKPPNICKVQPYFVQKISIRSVKKLCQIIGKFCKNLIDTSFQNQFTKKLIKFSIQEFKNSNDQKGNKNFYFNAIVIFYNNLCSCIISSNHNCP